MGAIPQRYLHAIILHSYGSIRTVHDAVQIGPGYEPGEENVRQIIKALKGGDEKALARVSRSQNLLAEELVVIRFKAENDKLYYALIYNSLEHEQTIEALAIIPLVS